MTGPSKRAFPTPEAPCRNSIVILMISYTGTGTYRKENLFVQPYLYSTKGTCTVCTAWCKTVNRTSMNKGPTHQQMTRKKKWNSTIRQAVFIGSQVAEPEPEFESELEPRKASSKRERERKKSGRGQGGDGEEEGKRRRKILGVQSHPAFLL